MVVKPPGEAISTTQSHQSQVLALVAMPNYPYILFLLGKEKHECVLFLPSMVLFD